MTTTTIQIKATDRPASDTRERSTAPELIARIVRRVDEVMGGRYTMQPTGDHSERGRAVFERALDEAAMRLYSALRTPGGTDVMGVVELLEEIAAAREEVRDARLRARLDALSQVRRALGYLRDAQTVQDAMDRATAQLCATCGFDRAMLSEVHEGRIAVRSVATPRDPAFAGDVLHFGRATRPRLAEMLIETEMVRRRHPILVTDVSAEPRPHREFTSFLSPRGYVAAPIMPAGEVLGFLHADLHDSDRAPDDLDRDQLGAFAEGFGYALDRARLFEQAQATTVGMRELLESVYGGFARPIHSSEMTASCETSSERLTDREQEVLGLMAEGCSNIEIADRLIIAPGTVKTHVSNILRKLSAGNRAEAVARYLRSRP